MTSKALGINLINMYEKMVREDFDPLISILTARCAGVKEKIVTQVKKDFGIYKLYEEKAALQVRISEIEKGLREYEVQNHRAGGEGYRFVSRIDDEVEKRLTELNAPLQEVTANKESILRQIRLAGVGQEIKSTFEGLPEVIRELSERFANLPAISETDIKALTSGVIDTEIVGKE